MEKKKPTKKKAKVTRQAFSSILSIGKDRLNLMESYLLKGEGLGKIAKIMQEEWGVLNNIKQSSLRMTLYRYKNEFFKDKQVIPVSLSETIDTPVTLLEQFKEKFKGCEDLVNVCNLQKARLNKILQHEAKIPTLLDIASREIMNTAKLIEMTVKLQMELGLIRPSDANYGGLNNEAINKVYTESLELTNKLKRMAVDTISIIDGEFEEVENGSIA